METIDEAVGFEGDDPMAFSNPAFQGDGLIRVFELLRIDGVCLGEKMGFSMGLIVNFLSALSTFYFAKSLFRN